MSDLTATRWTVVHAAQAGDANAVRRLCEKYRPAIVAYLERRGLGAEAEDVAQEALLALVQSALDRATSSAGPFRGLVFAVARNHLLRHLERAGAQKRGAGRVVPLGEMDPAATDRDPDFDREWLANLLRSALARLAEEQPQGFKALQRFLLDGKKQVDVAAELGISVEQVKKLVYRGKRRVAAYLREEIWSYSRTSREYATELDHLAAFLGERSENASAM